MSVEVVRATVRGVKDVDPHRNLVITSEALVLHKTAREISATSDLWPDIEAPHIVWHLPLCWQADLRARGITDDTDDLWNLSWDHGAIDPYELVFATDDQAVNCQDCLEWMHA